MENEAKCSLSAAKTCGSKKGAGRGLMISVLVGCEMRDASNWEEHKNAHNKDKEIGSSSLQSSRRPAQAHRNPLVD